MSTLMLPRRWPSAAAGSNKIFAAAVAVARFVHRRVTIWEDRRRLQALPDYLLADMGIGRSDVDRVVNFGRDYPLGPAYRL